MSNANAHSFYCPLQATLHVPTQPPHESCVVF